MCLRYKTITDKPSLKQKQPYLVDWRWKKVSFSWLHFSAYFFSCNRWRAKKALWNSYKMLNTSFNRTWSISSVLHYYVNFMSDVEAFNYFLGKFSTHGFYITSLHYACNILNLNEFIFLLKDSLHVHIAFRINIKDCAISNKIFRQFIVYILTY